MQVEGKILDENMLIYQNENELNTFICVFYDKVTKGGISTNNILLVDLEMLKIVRNV